MLEKFVVLKKIDNPNGGFTERKLNKDGSFTFHEQHPNGSFVETITDKNGTSKTIHNITADGTATEAFDTAGHLVLDRTTATHGSFTERTS